MRKWEGINKEQKEILREIESDQNKDMKELEEMIEAMMAKVE